MADNFSVEIEGLQQVQSRIASLPDAARKEVMADVSKYGLEVLKKEPPPKYVTRIAAYGKSFFSDRQRRWFFANLNDGTIQVPYHRTHALANSWRVRDTGHEVIFGNPTPSAPYVIGMAAQSRHEKLVGWLKITDTMAKYLDFRNARFRKVVEDAYQKAIRKVELG